MAPPSGHDWKYLLLYLIEYIGEYSNFAIGLLIIGIFSYFTSNYEEYSEDIKSAISKNNPGGAASN